MQELETMRLLVRKIPELNLRFLASINCNYAAKKHFSIEFLNKPPHKEFDILFCKHKESIRMASSKSALWRIMILVVFRYATHVGIKST